MELSELDARGALHDLAVAVIEYGKFYNQPVAAASLLPDAESLDELDELRCFMLRKAHAAIARLAPAPHPEPALAEPLSCDADG